LMYTGENVTVHNGSSAAIITQETRGAGMRCKAASHSFFW
jgi:hypothetical protein